MPADLTKETMLSGRVLRSTVSNYIGKIITLGTGFFLTPFILHQLGPVGFGLWALTSSVVGYGSLLDFGIGGAVIKYVAEYRAKGDLERASKLVATALALYTGLGLLAIVLGLALAPVFPDLFNIPAAQRDTASWLLLVSAVGVGVSIPAATTTAVLRGLQRFDLVNVINISATVLSAIATIVVLLLGGGVVGIVAASIPLTLIMQVPSVMFIRRSAPDLHFGWRGASRELVRSVLSYSVAIFGMNVGGRLQAKTDEIVIGATLPVSFVTPYALARGLSDVARILTDQFMKVLLPLASELHAERDTARLRALYTASTRLTLVIFTPIALVLVMLAQQILTAWVGPGYGQYAYLVFILTLASLIDTSQWPAGAILQGIARHRLLAVLSIGSGVANLVLSIALVGPLGLMGVALGTLIPNTVEALGLVLPYTLSVIGVRPLEAFRTILVPAILPALPMAAVLYAASMAFPLNSLVWIGLLAVGAGLVYLGAYLASGATRTEKQIYTNFVQNTLAFAMSRLRR